MKRTLIVSPIAAAVLAGVAPSQAAVIGPNTQTWADNAVENSGYSNTSMYVTGSDVNRQPSYTDVIAPGYTSRSTGYYTPGSNGPIWNPEAFSVAPGASALYRVTTPKTGWAGPWAGVQGGSAGAFVSADNLFRFFGCTPGVDPCTIQVIQTR